MHIKRNDALEASRAVKLADKERTSMLAGQISHLCREGGKVKADCQAHSLFSQTEKAAYESCIAGNAILQQHRHDDAQAAELRKAEYAMLQEGGERQKQLLEKNGSRYAKFEKEYNDLSLLQTSQAMKLSSEEKTTLI